MIKRSGGVDDLSSRLPPMNSIANVLSGMA
jgi:hypothetical protein